MSRIGKNAITVPTGVTVTITTNDAGVNIEASGKMGRDFYILPKQIIMEKNDNIIILKPKSSAKIDRMMWGTSQSRISSLVSAVEKGVTINLELSGVGYRASVQGDELILQLGFSHDIKYTIPIDMKVYCSKPTLISITGPSKQRVGQFAAEIRSSRPPEPYKAKGITREGEKVVRKEGKKK